LKVRFLQFLMLIFCINLYAQTQIDSLKTIWLDKKNEDSLRIKAFDEYIHAYFPQFTMDSILQESIDLVNFGEEYNYPLAIINGNNLISQYYDEIGHFSKALEHQVKSYKLIEELKLEEYFVGEINTLGSLYADVGNHVKSLEYYEKGIKISEEVGDKETLEMCISNIGGIYYVLKNYDRALEYFSRGKALEKEMGDQSGYASSILLISNVLMDKGDFEEATANVNEAIAIFKAINDEEGILEGYAVLGEINTLKENFDEALMYFELCKSSEIVQNSFDSKAYVYNRIGYISNQLKQYNKAIENCELSLKNAIDAGILSEMLDSYECLYVSNKAINREKKALFYLELANATKDSLNTQEAYIKIQQMEVQKQALNDSIQAAEERFDLKLSHQLDLQKKNRTRNIIIVIGLFVFVIALGLYSRWKSTQKSKAIIEKEKERSENLLLNILPADVAKELKEKGKADARDFDVVSILFTDFKEFTQTAEKLSAKELVKEINTCFKAFDNIIENYKIEKIKTIGDAYMAAGGLPVPNKNATKNTVLAGLEMQDFIIKRKKQAKLKNKISFEMRVGIHTGPIVAGIVGVKKFQYDIWGDTVNTASRVESSGEVEKVNNPQDTYNIIKDDSQFEFEYRGKIFAKGKGEIDMYFVKRKH